MQATIASSSAHIVRDTTPHPFLIDLSITLFIGPLTSAFP
jgi:hypothetical protein